DDALLQQADRVARHRVSESRMEFLGHRGAADVRMALEHDDTETRSGEIRGANETVMTAADDRGVVTRACWGFHRRLRPNPAARPECTIRARSSISPPVHGACDRRPVGT